MVVYWMESSRELDSNFADDNRAVLNFFRFGFELSRAIFRWERFHTIYKGRDIRTEQKLGHY